MKKYLFPLFIIIIISIFAISGAAAEEIFTPTWSTFVIDYVDVNDNYITDAFHFNNGFANVITPDAKRVDMIDMSISRFTLNNQYDDKTAAFYISYNVLFEVSGDPGIINAFYSGDIDDLVLNFKDNLTEETIYSVYPGIYKISNDGTNYYTVNQNALTQFANDNHLYFQIYFRIAASFTNSGFDPWLRFHGSEVPTQTNGFTVNILSSSIYYRLDESGVLNIIGQPIDGSGLNGIDNNLSNSIDEYEYYADTYFNGFLTLISNVGSGAATIFNLIISPLSDVYFSLGDSRIYIVNIMLTFAFIYFVIGIIWLIFGMSKNSGKDKK